jgi:deoxyribodipyrimidine photolyase
MRRYWPPPQQALRGQQRKQQLKPRGADRALENFLKGLAWREFSYTLLFHWPNLPEEPLRKEFAAFRWKRNSKNLKDLHRGSPRGRWRRAAYSCPRCDTHEPHI